MIKRHLKAIVCLLLVFFAGISLFAQKGPKDKFNFPPLNPIKMPTVETVKLANGLKLFLVQDIQYPTIDIRAMIHTGSVFEPPEKIGLAAITGQVLRTGGTASMTGDEIDQKLETLAAAISTGIGDTSGYFSVSLLKEDLDSVLEILADMLMNPAFSEDKIELAKIRQKAIISRRNDEIRGIAFREFDRLIYGKESAYGRIPEYHTIDAIARQDVVDFYKKFFHPNNTIMAVWGDFNPKDIAAKIKNTFGKWKAAELDVSPLPEVQYDFKFSVNYISKPDANQSNIILGHIGGLRNNSDYPALRVMNRILTFDRMFTKIRTDEGLAYNVWGTFGAGYKIPGVFSCGAQTKSESTLYAIELMLRELEKIQSEMVSDEELGRAKDQYLNSFVFNFDSRSEIVNRMMTYEFFGYPLDFMDRMKKEIEKVTKQDILRVAKKYLSPDKVQILVVGKKENFDKPLSTLGDVNEIDISIPDPEK